MSSTKEELSLNDRLEHVRVLMGSFAARTGLTSDEKPVRYLWTDAYAVCNYVGLAEATADMAWMARARELVDQVHHTLGRHRMADSRKGWLSGLSEEEGEAHPTAGGLRIGKPLPERSPEEGFDRQLEWDRDGQYFHYLTRWMVALDVMARATEEERYARWAVELAEVAHRGFVYSDENAAPRMYWKMSIALDRPQVPSMGHHDPLDGYVTLTQLCSNPEISSRALAHEIQSFKTMVKGRDWATSDALGLGGLLVDAYRVDQLRGKTEMPGGDELLTTLLVDGLLGLEQLNRTSPLSRPSTHRLAFRELGLAIGLTALEKTIETMRVKPERYSSDMREALEELAPYMDSRHQIVAFWLDPKHRQAETWTGHRDINEVMLATALLPDGCLR